MEGTESFTHNYSITRTTVDNLVFFLGLLQENENALARDNLTTTTLSTSTTTTGASLNVYQGKDTQMTTSNSSTTWLEGVGVIDDLQLYSHLSLTEAAKAAVREMTQRERDVGVEIMSRKRVSIIICHSLINT
jgi:hypothetical protein